MADERLHAELLCQREGLPQERFGLARLGRQRVAHGDDAHETKAPRHESARADALEELDRLLAGLDGAIQLVTPEQGLSLCEEPDSVTERRSREPHRLCLFPASLTRCSASVGRPVSGIRPRQCRRYVPEPDDVRAAAELAGARSRRPDGAGELPRHRAHSRSRTTRAARSPCGPPSQRYAAPPRRPRAPRRSARSRRARAVQGQTGVHSREIGHAEPRMGTLSLQETRSFAAPGRSSARELPTVKKADARNAVDVTSAARSAVGLGKCERALAVVDVSAWDRLWTP